MPEDPRYQIFNPFKRYHTLQIPEGVARYRGISPGAKLVYGRLYRYAGERGHAFPKVETLAEEVGLGVRQTQAYLSELREMDFIFLRRRYCQQSLYEFQHHPCLSGGDVGGPRWGRLEITKVDPQDTAVQSEKVDPQYTAKVDPQYTANPLGPILFNEEGHCEEGHNTHTAPLPYPTLDTGGIDPETGEETVRQHIVKKNWKRPKAEKPHAKSDRMRELREANYHGSGVTAPQVHSRSEQATPIPATVPSAAPSATPVHAPLPTPGPDCVSLWNGAFPDLAVDPTIYQNGNRPYAMRDGEMLSHMPDVIAKVRWLLSHGSDVTFSRLLQKESSGMFGWSAILSGSLDWTTRIKPDKKSKANEFIESELKKLAERRAAKPA